MKERLEKVKNHLKENKKVYVGVSAGVVIGFGGALALGSNQITISEALKLYYKSPHTTETTIINVPVRRGNPGNLTKCNETGEVFASVRRASEVLGLHRRDIFKQLHDVIPDVKGFTFTDLGEAK